MATNQQQQNNESQSPKKRRKLLHQDDSVNLKDEYELFNGREFRYVPVIFGNPIMYPPALVPVFNDETVHHLKERLNIPTDSRIMLMKEHNASELNTNEWLQSIKTHLASGGKASIVSFKEDSEDTTIQDEVKIKLRDGEVEVHIFPTIQPKDVECDEETKSKKYD